VTERRLADERLRVLDTVLSSSAQAIAIADPEGKLTFANAALRRLWGHASILLVEDDRRVRTFAEAALQRLGHTVHAFSNGRDALLALSSLSRAPDLLITDVVMPDVDGRWVADRVTAVFPSIRVLFVSGHTPDVVVDHGVSKDAPEFLPKPYSFDQLARHVHDLLRGSRR
jgi:DNA-binding NtrC family response regulator